MSRSELFEAVRAVVVALEEVARIDPDRAIDLCVSALAVWCPPAISEEARALCTETGRALWDPDLALKPSDYPDGGAS